MSLTADDIADVVQAFYAKIRSDAELGPVFAVHVKDWTAHEEKISRFWRNALLREPIYSGNPMQKHRAAGNVRPEHFDHWLALFDQTLHDHLPEDIANDWSRLAHRIGRSLRMGLDTSGIPKL